MQGGLPQLASSQGFRLVQPAAAQYGAFAVFFLAGPMQLGNPRLQEADLDKLVAGWPFLQRFADKAWPTPRPNATPCRRC